MSNLHSLDYLLSGSSNTVNAPIVSLRAFTFIVQYWLRFHEKIKDVFGSFLCASYSAGVS